MIRISSKEILNPVKSPKRATVAAEIGLAVMACWEAMTAIPKGRSGRIWFPGLLRQWPEEQNKRHGLFRLQKKRNRSPGDLGRWFGRDVSVRGAPAPRTIRSNPPGCLHTSSGSNNSNYHQHHINRRGLVGCKPKTKVKIPRPIPPITPKPIPPKRAPTMSLLKQKQIVVSYPFFIL